MDVFSKNIVKTPTSMYYSCKISDLFRSNGSVKILTKGDNNSVDDRGLYAPGQLWLEKKDIVGRARGFVSFFLKFSYLEQKGFYVLIK